MPGTFRDLAQRTGMTDAQLSRHLAALYMVGAITADPKRAPAPRSAVEASRMDVGIRFGPSVSSPPGPEMTVKLTLANVRQTPAGSLS